jgi:hypothetical protein
MARTIHSKNCRVMDHATAGRRTWFCTLCAMAIFFLEILIDSGVHKKFCAVSARKYAASETA